MRASARVASALGPGGRSRLVDLAGAPPLVPRRTGASSVHLVGAAGGPLPGDRTRLELDVAAGATLVVASAAATVALPGPDAGLPASVHEICARVGPGGVLVVLGQALVAAAGSRHAVRATVELATDARLVWRDLLVPGRTGETSGDLQTRLRVTRDGVPLLDTSLRVGPGSQPALGGQRCAGSLAVLGGARLAAARAYGTGAVALPLAPAGCALGTALGAAHEVDRALRAIAVDLVAGTEQALVAAAW